jgi:hypothetical protein
MAAPNNPRHGISALVAAFTGKADAATVDAFAQMLEARHAETTGRTMAVFQVIDAKASGLLTHVSMMIAGLGICAPLLAQHRLEEILIISQIIVYMIIAIGCLRCLSVARTPVVLPTDNPATLNRELFLKYEMYRLCNKATIYFTIVVFVSFPIMLVWP